MNTACQRGKWFSKFSRVITDIFMFEKHSRMNNFKSISEQTSDFQIILLILNILHELTIDLMTPAVSLKKLNIKNSITYRNICLLTFQINF